MDNPKKVIIVLGFAVLITALFWLGFSAQERYFASRTEHREALARGGPTSEIPSSATDVGHRPIELSFGIALGVGLALVGYGWLVFAAFSEGAGWGVAVLVGNCLGAVAFLAVCPDRAWKPMSAISAGILLVAWSVTGARFP